MQNHERLNPGVTDSKPVQAPRRGALPSFGVLALQGPQALDFLHAQCMNDLRALPDLHWQWNGVLSPKGRVIALFALLRVAADDWLAIAPDMDASALAEHFRRYVFRTKVRLVPRDDLRACGAIGDVDDDAAHGARAARIGDGFALDLGGDAPRRLVLGGEVAHDDPHFDAAWRLVDIRHGLPRLSADERDAWTPNMLSLERLNAFSVKKGCYPGQEIVARTHFLGKAKRGLVRLATDQAIPTGADITRQENVLGRVVCAASLGDTHEALAVLPLPPEADGLAIAGRAARVLPLAEGLAR